MAKISLPRYVRVKKTKQGVSYYWEPPHWSRGDAVKDGRKCPVVATALGSDLAVALQRAEVLNAGLDGWRKGELGLDTFPGSIAWLFEQFQQSDRFKSKAGKTQLDYRRLMKSISDTPMKVGTFGQRNAASVDGLVADQLYEKFKAKGKRQATYAMQVCRLVWNWAGRLTRKTGIKQGNNPFAGMSLDHKVAEGNLAATREQYEQYRAAAKELGFQSMATAAALAFELIQRVSDCFGFEDPVDADQAAVPSDERGIRWPDYYAGFHITVRQNKTGKLVTIPLTDGFGPDREFLYPELEAELDASSNAAQSKDGLIILEERNGQPYKPRRMSDVHRRICDHAGLPKKLTFTSFRHGGATELGNAGETDIRSISGHAQLSTTLIYNKANQEKARRLARSRRAHLDLISGDGKLSERDDD